MKHTQKLGLAACLIAVVAAAAPVAAQLKKAPSPAGAWGFKTEPLGAGCVLAGDIRITQTADRAYKCNFTAVWSCSLRMPRSVTTEQSCVATQAGHEVTITSKMEKVAKVDPVEMTQGMRERYAADNFQLKINPRGDEMDGMFHSYGAAPVKFRKRLELIS